MPTQEDIADQQGLLTIYRGNLKILLRQAAKFGGEDDAPLHIVNGIRDARDNIRRIKDILRGWSVDVTDDADDEKPSVATIRNEHPSKDTYPQIPAPPVTQSQPATPANNPVSAIGSTSPTDNADVFISYHPADKEWVRKQLLPLLEQQHGLRAIIDYRDFEVGVPKLVNIENAVANSRHTLIVMTPDWIANEWNSFQGLLAGSADPNGVQAKLMPVMLKQAAIPNRIKFLEPTDLTDPEEREIQLQRLIRSIKGSGS